VAVKVVKMKKIIDYKLHNTLMQELSLTFSQGFDHKNIVKCIDALHTKEFLY
jgi:hypothetical protein